MRRATKGSQPVGSVKAARTARLEYRVPAIWDCWGYRGPRRRIGGELLIDPEAYFEACLNWIREQTPKGFGARPASLSRIRGVRKLGMGRVRDGSSVRRGGDWLAQQVLYGMMIRTSTAWDHDGDGRLSGRRYPEMGTFLKSILLMPRLWRMGVTVLYLLPVVKVSRLFRKGQLGCPYSAKNFLKLDPDQQDPLLGRASGGVEQEFALFVECAHRLGMRVMLDVAPRTAARDCDWVLDHPEWFYWIDRRIARRFQAPRLPDVAYPNPIPGRLREIYEAPGVLDFIRQFRFAPSITHPAKWERFVEQARRRPPANLIDEIGRHFGVIVPPAFSDIINDPQPAWSDVTYLRLYLDHPAEAVPLLPDPKGQPPYVLFDTIKANLFPGRRPNRDLWRQLIGIIPFYQRFGIDGARVDMAHALPDDLELKILTRPRRLDPDFALLAEDLGTAHHVRHRRAGYNMIIGPGWYEQARGHLGRMHAFVGELPGLKLPVMAAAETPDTPRAAVRRGGRRFSRQAAVLNCFLPNAVPMINSGMEVFERQPMNLGLDVGPPGRDALPATDPQAGKLAFFDPYALHWTNRGGAAMVELIARATSLRRRYLAAITRRRGWLEPRVDGDSRWVLATGFKLGRTGSLLMLANLDFARPRRASVTLPRGRRRGHVEVLLEMTSKSAPRIIRGRLTVTLPPGDVKVIHL